LFPYSRQRDTSIPVPCCSVLEYARCAPDRPDLGSGVQHRQGTSESDCFVHAVPSVFLQVVRVGSRPMDAVQSCLVFPLLPVYSPHLVKDLDGVFTRPCLPTSPLSSVGVRWLFFIVCHLVVRSKVAVVRWHLYGVAPGLRRMVVPFRSVASCWTGLPASCTPRQMPPRDVSPVRCLRGWISLPSSFKVSASWASSIMHLSLSYLRPAKRSSPVCIIASGFLHASFAAVVRAVDSMACFASSEGRRLDGLLQGGRGDRLPDAEVRFPRILSQETLSAAVWLLRLSPRAASCRRSPAVVVCQVATLYAHPPQAVSGFVLHLPVCYSVVSAVPGACCCRGDAPGMLAWGVDRIQGAQDMGMPRGACLLLVSTLLEPLAYSVDVPS
jgi:hypothetical protein